MDDMENIDTVEIRISREIVLKMLERQQDPVSHYKQLVEREVLLLIDGVQSDNHLNQS